jgi:hypothetical protein
LYQSDGVTPIEGATITLMNGNKQLDYEITKSDGKYTFTVPSGAYTLVSNYNGISDTTLIELFEDKEQDIEMLEGNTQSLLTVNSDDENNFGVAVGGLNEEAKAIRKADNLSAEQSLSVMMTVETKTQQTAKNAKPFEELTTNKSFMFFDVTLEKTVDSTTTQLSSSENVIEIAVPYEKINRRGIEVYYCDGGETQVLKESNSKEEGTFRIDKENGLIFIYAKSFSTFAIGYTPYYQVNTSVSLGSFEGSATVIVNGLNGEGEYTLDNVSLSNISFADIPKGKYEMTITWEDGATNTLKMPITVS